MYLTELSCQVGFFDFYIIPLAKKLKDCGVFGVSSDEYLNYAKSNRQEWEQKGEEIVKEYIASYEEASRGGNFMDMDMSSRNSMEKDDLPTVGFWKNAVEC